MEENLVADIATRALHAIVDNGGNLTFNINSDNVEVARELGDTAVRIAQERSNTLVTIASIYVGYQLLRPIIDGAFRIAFGGERPDQNTGRTSMSSLHVPVHCLTDERFLEVLADYESGEIKRRLEKELVQVGLKVEGLRVEIENMDDVNERKRTIKKRLDCRRVDIVQDMEEITEEEQKAALRLGETVATIMMLHSGGSKTPKPRRDIRLLYKRYIGIASKLGFRLEDPPPEETTTDVEMEKFITKQSNKVDECLVTRGNIHIITLYNASCQLSFLMAYLRYAIKCKDNPVGRIQVNEYIQTYEKKLKSSANELGIDLSEELKKAMIVKQTKEIDEIEKQIQKKFGRRKQSQKKRSEIDPTRIITDEDWTVSLVRLPDTSVSSEHAFLVVEGKSGNTSKICFLDFVASDRSDLFRPGMRDGKVRIDFHESIEVPGSPSKLLFQGRKMMMKIENGDRLLSKTWPIQKVTAETLIKNIEAQQASPPKYNILGNTMLAASSATSSSKDTGHNCFTFARTMLRDLNDEYITIPENTLDKWILSATSRYLVEKQVNNKSWKTTTFALILALVFLAGVITAYFLPKLL